MLPVAHLLVRFIHTTNSVAGTSSNPLAAPFASAVWGWRASLQSAAPDSLAVMAGGRAVQRH